MALEYYLYRTDYNNTLVDRSTTSFAPLPPNTGEIQINFFIPQNQPLYFYREQSGSIVLNDDQTIRSYLNDTVDKSPDSYVTYGQLTGYTATTNISGISESVFNGYTATTESTINGKLNKGLFNTYTGSTAPNTFLSKTIFNTYTGSTALQSANNGLTKNGTNVRLGGTLTGATTITSPATGSRLTFAGFPIQYSTNLSANYNARSLVDNGYVTGITNNKIDKVFGATNNIAIFDANGNLKNSNVSINTITGGTGFYYYIDRSTTQNNTTTTDVVYLSGRSGFLDGGTWSIDFNAVGGNITSNRSIVIGFYIDNVLQGVENRIQSNASVNVMPFILTKDLTLTSGIHTFEIRFRQVGGGTAFITYGSIRAKQVR